MAFTTGEEYHSRRLSMIPRLTEVAGFEMGVRRFINSLFNKPGASPTIAATLPASSAGQFQETGLCFQ
jgi:hypothetical protein